MYGKNCGLSKQYLHLVEKRCLDFDHEITANLLYIRQAPQNTGSKQLQLEVDKGTYDGNIFTVGHVLLTMITHLAFRSIIHVYKDFRLVTYC
jgi:hypothetical protein